jgi:outer membrane lipoprotein LolB
MSARAFAACVLAAALAACAAIPRAPRDPPPFDLLGRVLVTYSGGAVTANLRWQHSSEQDQIWLMTPTGQTLAFIVDTREGATLTRADKQQYRAASVEALTRQALGWSLPLSLLQYWVRGQPAPGSAASGVDRGSDNQFLSLTQSGWRAAFTYHQEGEMKGKARRLDLSDGENEIRLLIDTWREPEEP